MVPPSLVGRKVAILGAGKVGCAVGVTLGKAGLPVVAVTTRSARTATQAAHLTGGAPCTDNPCAAALADIVLVTTNDDAIAQVVSQVAEAGAFRSGQLVVHMSGALRLDVLEPAARAGALIGAAHPLRSFATYYQAVRDIPGSVFGVTAGPDAAEQLDALVRALDGRSHNVPDDRKILYHAAAVMASNYLVAVEDMATQLLADAGFDESTAIETLGTLARGTLDNVVQLGTTNALTGPIVRGDVETVRGHIAALEGLPADRLELYKTLGRHTLAIASRRGVLPDGTLAELRDLLGPSDSA